MSARRSRIESTLLRVWSTRGVAACALFPVSLVFRLLTALRRSAYACGLLKSARLPVPVIVVGNIFIGGTGKTPLTIWLVQALQQAGFRPGVISRGYGAKNSAPCIVNAMSIASEVGDEPMLIALHAQVPVMVGRNRAAAARALLDHHADVDVIVSDDGLQHYALARDIEIVLFDARGIGNGWLLPAGPLRESPSRRSDFVVLNAASMPPGIGRNAVRMRLIGTCAERLVDRTQKVDLVVLQAPSTGGQYPGKILASAGIGNPDRFFDMLEGAGLRFDRLPLPDHHDFSDNPFDTVVADIILITEKDAVKCRQIDNIKNDPRVWVVPVTAHIDDALAERILEKLRGHPTA